MTPHEAADGGVKTYTLKLGPCSEEDHLRLVRAISDRDEQIERLREAASCVLDDMGKAGHQCCNLAKAMLRVAYGADDPDGPLEYTWEEARDSIVTCDELHGKRSKMRDAVKPTRASLTPRGEGD